MEIFAFEINDAFSRTGIQTVTGKVPAYIMDCRSDYEVRMI